MAANCDIVPEVLSGKRSEQLKVKYIYADHVEAALRLVHELFECARDIVNNMHPDVEIEIPRRINWPMISEFNVFQGLASIELYITQLDWSPNWSTGIELFAVKEHGYSTYYIYLVTWSVRRKNTPINQYYLNTYFVFEICNLYPKWARVMVRIYIEGVDMIFRPHDAKFSEYFIITQIQNRYLYSDLWER